MGSRLPSKIKDVDVNTPDVLAFLTDKQRILAREIANGRGTTQAARIAGYVYPNVNGMQEKKKPMVAAAIRYLQRKNAQSVDMTRKKVMDGFLEAIDMARIQGESATMVAGWREIGKMCGFYAPETKNVNVNVTQKRVVGKLETLSDAELAELIEKDGAAIENAAYEVLGVDDGD